MTLRLVLADDHSVVLQGMRAFLALEAEMEVSALCADGLEAVEAVVEHQPDVLVIDASMPRCGGIEALDHLRVRGYRVPTVLLTGTLSDDDLVRCVRAGVDGIVLKESAAEVLVDAIHTVARGERWIPTALATRALELMARVDEPADELTPREREVATRVAGGALNKRVAADLGIAESTVKIHLSNVFRKLGVRNRTQLSLLARERGWL